LLSARHGAAERRVQERPERKEDAVRALTKPLVGRITRIVALMASVAGGSAAALPITFEVNRGQAPREVAFLSRASGYRVFLTRSGAVIGLQDGNRVRLALEGARETMPVGTARWKRTIENLQRVTYPHIYPVIDWNWHGRGAQVENDFLVEPGGEPRRIHLTFSGAALRLTPEGDLMSGDLRYQKPHAYQDGSEVDCRYALQGDRVNFKSERIVSVHYI